jgi:mono/diheme cytochrome c family protein
MKKTYLSLIVLSVVFASCGGGEETTVEANAIEETTTEDEVVDEVTTEETANYTAGEEIYTTTCLACHQATGEGIAGAFPPLAGSDYLLEDRTRAIEQVLNGSSGEIVVNGETYNGVMPAQILSNEQVRDVVNYILNSWGNEGGEVTIEEVTRAKHP